MQRRFLILGAAGLIGRTLVRRLESPENELFLVDIREIPKKKGQHFILANALEGSTITHLVDEVQPQVVINCINLATIFSADTEVGYPKIIRFYLNLYRALVSLTQPVHYLQMGTTGSGGLGLNIPFTHGGKLEDLPIINKAAFSGITTSMLTLLSRSFPSGMVKVSEIKPGLAIFAEGTVIEHYAQAVLAAVDGGESGYYSYNELALLTQYMGYISVERIIDTVEEVLAGKRVTKEFSEYDIIHNLNTTIIAPEEEDVATLQAILEKLRSAQKSAYIIGTGNLGPPSITRDLIFGHLYLEHPLAETPSEFKKLLKQDASVSATLAYVHEKHPQLFRYLEEECTFAQYRLVYDYFRPGAEPWQTAGASLSKNPHITKVG